MNIFGFLKWLAIIAIVLCFLYGPAVAHAVLLNAAQTLVSGFFIALVVLVETFNGILGILGLNLAGALAVVLVLAVVRFIYKS